MLILSLKKMGMLFCHCHLFLKLTIAKNYHDTSIFMLSIQLLCAHTE